MRTRWIVVNPAYEWIQGDVDNDTAQGAALSVERAISGDTPNESWDVYRVPALFPTKNSTYSGGDPALLESLRSSDPVVVRNARYAPELAFAC